MSDSTVQSHDQSMPPPARFVLGVVQLCFGLALCLPIGIMRVFPLTAPLGVVMLKPVSQMSFHGGSNIARGIGGTFGMIGRALSSKTPAD